MKNTAWAYYSSGADDEITMRENKTAFHKIWFRPRILVDVEKVRFYLKLSYIFFIIFYEETRQN